MANAKLTALTALAEAPNDADLVYVIDSSDTTDGASGTGKKITAANLKSGLVAGTLVTTVGATGSDTNIPSEQAVREAIAAIPGGGDMLADGTVPFTAKVSYNAAKTFSGDLELVSKDYVDGAITAAGGYTDEAAQDAVGAMVDSTLTYTDGTPELKVTNPVTPQTVGFTIAAGTTSKTLTVPLDASVSGTNTGDNAANTSIAATKLDDFTAPDDNTDLNASTSAHGLVVKATAPTAGLINMVGIANGETAYTNKPLFDATAPSTQAFGDSAATGSATVSARRDHKHAMPAAPTISGLGGVASTTVAKISQGTTAPASPATGDLWVDVN